MRINKYIAASGVTSRRKADELIKNGNVKVNNITLTEPGYDVKEGDIVEVNGNVIAAEEKKVYYLLNKPVGFVSTVNDEFDRPTVIELMKDAGVRVFPVGRLDYNTSGMLIMTNDGDFAYKVTHPKHELGKTYRAKITGFLTKSKLEKLKEGVDIGGFVTSPAEIEIVKELQKHTVADITIHEGKYHQVRKMFEVLGNEVVELERIAIGSIRLGHLALGSYRRLTRQEIEALTK